MKNTMPKTTKKQKKAGKGGAGPGLLLIAACGVAAFIALSSPLLGLFYGGFSLVCVLLYRESRQRIIGQNDSGFKIKTLEENSRFFSSENLRTRKEVIDLQSRVKTIEEKGGAKKPAIVPGADAVAPKKIPGDNNFGGKFMTMLKRSSMPRAVKPGVKMRPGKMAANDRAYDDDMGLSDLVVEELVQHAVSESAVHTFMQPIMRLPQRRPEYYEIYARIRARPGVYMPAARYLAIAHDNNLVPSLDKILLEECIKIIQATSHMERAAPFFMNITGASLKNKSFMNTLLLFLARNRALAGRIVLEMTQGEFSGLDAPARKIMKALGQLGCGFSLDNMQNFTIDEEALKNLNIKFVKISAQTLLDKAKKDTDFAAMRHTKNRLEKAGIKLVAEKIEDEKILKELADYDIGYGQGVALAKPDLQAAFEGQYRERA